MTEFQGFPSIHRLNRDMTVTEKIDGTNAGIHIEPAQFESYWDEAPDGVVGSSVTGFYVVTAQSRKNLIYPGKDDNHGFAAWVRENAHVLAEALGEGLHFGEWWGSGINRGYGLPKGDKRFSLFNTLRWREVDLEKYGIGLGMVPELYVGPFSTETINEMKALLLETGSIASPGFDRPEGVVVFHHSARAAFKTTYDKCDVYGFEGGKTWKK